jgi:hypothetical protein
LVQSDKTRVAVRINCPAAVAPGFRTEPDRHQAYGVDAGDEPASGRHGTEHADQHCGCHRSARHHNPPSFYAAFGNKAGLYARILGRYAGTDAISLADLLRSDRPMAECLAAVLEEAARRYAADPAAAGCRAGPSGLSAALAGVPHRVLLHTISEAAVERMASIEQ